MKAVISFRVLLAALALGAALALFFSGLGYRFGWWHFRTGTSMVRWSGYASIAALALTIVGLALPRVRARSTALLGAALVVSAIVAGIIAMWGVRGLSLPRIHDITTDMENPPAFVAVLALRAGADNKPAYDGKEAADGQRSAYPDIRPVVLKMPPRQAFERARDAAEGMGWDMVSADPSAGRIEAVATSFWFGFKDDVVIRVAAADGGTRIDVRSKSRVGRSDFGANANRVRAYLDKLRGQAAS